MGDVFDIVKATLTKPLHEIEVLSVCRGKYMRTRYYFHINFVKFQLITFFLIWKKREYQILKLAIQFTCNGIYWIIMKKNVRGQTSSKNEIIH